MTRILILLLLIAPGASAETLDTSRLVGVIAGVLSWEDTSLTTYSPERRKDQELHELLVSRGASPERLALILDAEATTARVRGEIARTAALAESGDTFVFYYAGHGMKQEDGRVVFATWDVRSREALATGLVAQELAELLRDFRGRRVLLWADCCHSGALMHVARALAQRGIPAAAITSADLASASTDNWTFTQTVIDAFRGDAMGDRDGDGTVTLGELGAEVRDAMAGRERQRAGEALCGVPPDLALARARGGRPTGAGAYVEVQTDRGWEAARVVASGQKPRVQLYRYTDKVDLEVEPGAIRPRAWKRYPVGAAIDVTWEGKVYEAQVKAMDGDFHWIGYPGWSDTWDEWVLSDRIVGPHQKGRRLDAVEVEWGGRWWPALVMRTEGESTCIHYVGYDASWDECVGPDRVRAAR